MDSQLSPQIETQLRGSFGSIELRSWTTENLDVAVKVIDCKLSSVLAVQCEAKVLSIVGWHPLFPKFYGINGTHRLVMEDLGWYDDQGKYCVTTTQSLMGRSCLNRSQWIDVCRQVVEGVMFFHDIAPLHAQ